MVLHETMSESLRGKDGFLKCPTCCRRFFTKVAFQIHSANEHNSVTPPFEKDHKNENEEMVENVLTLRQDTADEIVPAPSKEDFLNNANKAELNSLKSDIPDVLIEKNKNLTSQMSKVKIPYQCQICKKMFSRVTFLKAHSKAIHEKVRLYQCQSCELTFGFKCSLGRHFKAVHEKLRPHQCQQCKASFFQKGGLTIHTRSVHEKVKPGLAKTYQCQQCKAPFDKKYHLKNHLHFVHEKARPVQCQQCKKYYSKNNYLKLHIETVHKKLRHHQCHKCNMFFSLIANLQKHAKNIHEKNKQL